MRFRYYYVFIVLPIFPFLVNGQMNIGIKLGANAATIKGIYSDPVVKIGWYGGGFLNVPFNKRLGLQLELLYSSKGTGTSITYYGPDYVPPKTKQRFNYLNVPVLFSYNAAKKISLTIGPEIGYLVSVKEVYPDLIANQTASQPEKFDFSVDIGASYHFLKKYGFEIRYTYGMKAIHYVDVERKPWPEKAANRVIQIGFNYLLH